MDTQQLKDLMGIRPELENEDLLPIPEEVAKPSLTAESLGLQTDFFDVKNLDSFEDFDLSEKELAQESEPIETSESEQEDVDSLDVNELIDSLEDQLSETLESDEVVEESAEDEIITDDEPVIEIAEIEFESSEEVFEVEQVDNLTKTTTQKTKKVNQASQQKINQTYNDLLKKLQKSKILKSDLTKDKGKISKADILRVKALIRKNISQTSQKKLGVKYKSPPMTAAMQREYVNSVNQMLKKHWQVALETDEDLIVSVSVKIAKNGDILNYEIVETSGNFPHDQSVKDLFRRVKKWAPLPKGYPGLYYEFGWKF